MFCFNSGSNPTKSGRDICRRSWRNSFSLLTESHFALPKCDLIKFTLNTCCGSIGRGGSGKRFASIPDQIRPNPAKISAVEVGEIHFLDSRSRTLPC